MTGYKTARAVADKLKEENQEQEQMQIANKEQAVNSLAVASELYGTKYANAGTEEVSQDDINTPVLKLIQDSTKNLPDKKVGWFHRSDTGEQLETVDVNFVYVTTKEGLNYKKNAMEKYKVYFGFYTGNKEPFKMFIRGKSLASHRQLQSEILSYKNRHNLPMFALTVRLSSRQEIGTAKDGSGYDIRQIIFTILKDENGTPIIETDPNRVGFLLEAVERFKGVAEDTTMEDASV